MGALTAIVGDSPAIARLREQIEHILKTISAARRPPPVLIAGETGTGKGLVAQTLHRAGPRAHQPFVDVNCAAIPEALLEAELFGFERGAFTDARQAKPGLFQTAHRGTLFLDEIGLLSEALQAKLLKVVEDGSVRRLGATRAEPVDVWILAATNADLAAAIELGRFRADLYHRLAVLTLELPPLRERGGDVALLAERFLAQACADYGLGDRTLAPEAAAALAAHPWPGNVRELGNVIERVALLTEGPVIAASMLGFPAAPGSGRDVPPPEPARPTSSRDRMKEHLLETLAETGWNISRAASLLGVSRNTVAARIARFGLRPGGSPGQRVRPPEAPAPIDPPRTAATARRWERRHAALLKLQLAVPADQEGSADHGRALDAVIDKVHGFGGTVESLGPTGLLASFGLEPIEDAAERATLAALAVQKATERTGPHDGAPPRARVAVHADTFLVSRVGDRVHLDAAAREAGARVLDALVASAAAGAVLASDRAATMLRRRFRLTPLAGGDARAGEGVRVAGIARAKLWLGGQSSEFVGRSSELGALHARLALAVGGQGQVVVITGEPGIGKSRLLHEFRRTLRRAGARYLEGHCVSYGAGFPFRPVADLLRRATGLADGDSRQDVMDKVQHALRQLEIESDEATALLARLLGVPAETPTLSALTPEVIGERTLEAVLRMTLAASRRDPLVLALEDLHWIDRASERYLSSLVERLADACILLVVTARPGGELPMLGRPYATHVSLSRLDPEDAVAVARFSLHRGADDGLARQIAAQAEGNPLFIEELARAVAAEPEGRVIAEVPSSIDAIVSARLARLPGGARALLETASVVGRQVPARLLAAVAENADAIPRHLQVLQKVGLLYPDHPRAEQGYAFTHALTQEVVYQSIAAGRRQTLHRAVGHAVEGLYPERLEEHAELLAHHFRRSGDVGKTLEYLDLANRKAAKTHALLEATAYFEEAMALLDRLPESQAADRRRLELLLRQFWVFRELVRYAEYHDLLVRYEPLAVRLGDAALLGALRARLGFTQYGVGRYDEAIRTLTDAAAACEAHGLIEDATVAYTAWQWCHMHKGDFAETLALRDQILRLTEQRFTLQPFVLALFASANVSVWMGRWHDAGADAGRALEAAERFDDDASRAFALAALAWLDSERGDPAGAVRHATMAVARSSRPVERALAQLHLGIAYCGSDDPRRGIEIMRAVLLGARAARHAGVEIGALVTLGKGYLRAGMLEDARPALEEALRVAEERGINAAVARALRLLGEHALGAAVAGVESPPAAPYLERAIELCGRVGLANDLALAHASYGRLLAARGDIGEARSHLARALDSLERLGTLKATEAVRQELARLTA